jgi:GT2 family glycosyltransferase
MPLTGDCVATSLTRHAGEVALASQGLPDPDVSIVIRSKNNIAQLGGLFDDLEAQSFDGGVELIVVDTESNDGAPLLAKAFGAEVLTISQADFSYPKALNMGFGAASNPWVLSLVDHSLLAHDQTLRLPSRCAQYPNIAAVSGITLPNANASKTELMASAALLAGEMRRPARISAKTGMGIMATNASFIRRDAWRDAGGFDESYGAGGEDGALAREILARGRDILIDPAMAVHHTHGLSLGDSLKQLRYWSGLGKPRAFSKQELAVYRPELREKA